MAVVNIEMVVQGNSDPVRRMSGGLFLKFWFA
jgi:hypothetical protein